jgi:hypothetical protein
MLMLALLASLGGCGTNHGASASNGGSGTSGSVACPSLAGTWTIETHCQSSYVGSQVVITQHGCEITSTGSFSGFAGTVAPDGSYDLTGMLAGMMKITCTGTATAKTLTQTCPGGCVVTLGR